MSAGQEVVGKVPAQHQLPARQVSMNPRSLNRGTHREIVQVCIRTCCWLHESNLSRLPVGWITPQLVCLVGQLARLHD